MEALRDAIYRLRTSLAFLADTVESGDGLADIPGPVWARYVDTVEHNANELLSLLDDLRQEATRTGV